MRTVVVNLDRDWDFSALVRSQALDLYREPLVELWDVRPRRGGEGSGIWGDWPRVVPEDKLLAEFEEVLVGEPARRLLIVFLADHAVLGRLEAGAESSAGGEDAQPRQVDAHFFRLLQRRLADHGASSRAARLLAVSPVNESLALDRAEGLRAGRLIDDLFVLGSLAEEGSARPTADERRFLVLRALLALYADDTERDRLWRFYRQMGSREKALRLSLEGQQPKAAAKALQRAAGTLLHDLHEARMRPGAEAQAAAAGLPPAELDKVIDQIRDLTAVRTAGDPAFASAQEIRARVGRFASAELTAAIADFPRTIKAELQHRLDQTFQQLTTEQAEQRNRLDADAQALERKLIEEDGRPLTLSAARFQEIEATLSRLRAEHERVSADAKRLRSAMQGDINRETKRNLDPYTGVAQGYRRPIFDEDSRLVDSAGRAAAEAGAMMARPSFNRAVLVAAGLAGLPLAAEAVGVAEAALNIPGADLGAALVGLWPSWLVMLIPAAAFVLLALSEAGSRAAAAREAVQHMEDQARGLVTKGFRALAASYDYVNHSMALYRLSLLIDHHDRLKARMNRSGDRIHQMLSSFSEQRDDTLDMGPATTQMMGLKPHLIGRDSDSWLETLLANWPSLDAIPIEILDARTTNHGRIQTACLLGVQAIRLTTLPEPGGEGDTP